MDESTIEGWARELVEARATRTIREPITATTSLSLDDAYAIQQRVTGFRTARGEQVVGWKLGYTSIAMREQMGIDAPNFGPLTDAMLLSTGESTDDRLLQPRVEPEIGLRFARPLRAPVDVDDVLAAVDHAFACLEVVDSVYRDYRFQLVDNTADGSSAAQVVVGPPLPSIADLANVSVELLHNGVSEGTATGAAASGHPAVGVVWLVDQLAQRGQSLRAGDIVITGGLMRAVALAPGDRVTARYDDSTEVAVTRGG